MWAGYKVDYTSDSLKKEEAKRKIAINSSCYYNNKRECMCLSMLFS